MPTSQRAPSQFGLNVQKGYNYAFGIRADASAYPFTINHPILPPCYSPCVLSSSSLSYLASSRCRRNFWPLPKPPLDLSTLPPACSRTSVYHISRKMHSCYLRSFPHPLQLLPLQQLTFQNPSAGVSTFRTASPTFVSPETSWKSLFGEFRAFTPYRMRLSERSYRLEALAPQLSQCHALLREPDSLLALTQELAKVQRASLMGSNAARLSGLLILREASQVVRSGSPSVLSNLTCRFLEPRPASKCPGPHGRSSE